MTALVTGGTGFVGSHVARLLVSRGEPIRALARSGSKLDNLTVLDPRLTEIVTGDLNDPGSLREALTGCDALYHVAADYRLWAKDPKELYRSNVEGTHNILQAAADAGIARIVYEHGWRFGDTAQWRPWQRRHTGYRIEYDRPL